MTDTSSEIRRTTEKQREAMETGQKAMMESFQFPFEQWMEFQRGATEMVLNGLETQEETQRRNVELARTAFNDYLDAVGRVSQSLAGAARTAVEETADTQQRAVRTGSQQLAEAGEASTQGTQSTTAGSPGAQRTQLPPAGSGQQSPGYREGARTRDPGQIGGGTSPPPTGAGGQASPGYQQGTQAGTPEYGPPPQTTAPGQGARGYAAPSQPPETGYQQGGGGQGYQQGGGTRQYQQEEPGMVQGGTGYAGSEVPPRGRSDAPTGEGPPSSQLPAGSRER